MPEPQLPASEAREVSLDLCDNLDILFGPTPLLPGEDPKAYQVLKEKIFASVRPADIIEQIDVDNILNDYWEARRLRRYKTLLQQTKAFEGVEKLLRPFNINFKDIHRLARHWAQNDEEAVAEVDALIEQADFDHSAIEAHTFAVNLDTFERLDRLIAQADARVTLVLRELERRRLACARRLREALQVEDASFRELPPAPVSQEQS